MAASARAPPTLMCGPRLRFSASNFGAKRSVASVAQQSPAQLSLPTVSRNFPHVLSAVTRAASAVAAGPGNAVDAEDDSEDQVLAEVERKLNLAKLHEQLQLLTEWGQIKRLDELLRLQGQGDDLVSSDVLGRLLQLALLENHPDIAKIALSHGANVEAY